jgi:hypothetical protein
MTNGSRRGEGSASRPGRCLPSGKTRYPLYSRLGRPQGLSGQVRKFSPPTGIRSPDCPAPSQSLYRLSYQAHVSLGSHQENTCGIILMNSSMNNIRTSEQHPSIIACLNSSNTNTIRHNQHDI